MLKSPCICTTFSRFNIFDEKMFKKLKMLKFSIFGVHKIVTAAAGDTILLYVLYSSILGKVKILKNIYLRTSSDQA